MTQFFFIKPGYDVPPSLVKAVFDSVLSVMLCLETLCVRMWHTPSTASGTFLQRKDVVNQCLEFAYVAV